MKGDKYIEILKFADKQSKFTLQDIKEKVELSDDEVGTLALHVQQGSLFINKYGSSYIRDWKQQDLYLTISVEDKFRLLEYTELQEARTASRRATYFAGAALVVSIVATVISWCK